MHAEVVAKKSSVARRQEEKDQILQQIIEPDTICIVDALFTPAIFRSRKAGLATCGTISNMTLNRRKIKNWKSRGRIVSMKKIDLEALSVNDLWSLHEQISEILSVRIAAEKRELEKRLAVLNRGRDAIQGNDSSQSYNANGRRRRKYPRVFPKYRDPQTSETWSGRGKTPRWLVAAIKKGRKIEDFEIQASESKNRR